MKKKIIITLMGVLLVTTYSSPIPTFAQTTNAMNQNTHVEQIDNLTGLQPKSHKIQWRYKTINGKVYRRLYNYTTNEWIGNWELV